jgi:hypothetical protein
MAGNRTYHALQPFMSVHLNVKNVLYSGKNIIQILNTPSGQYRIMKRSFCIQVAKRRPFHKELGAELIGLLSLERAAVT